jgi:xanthine/uracil permease
MGDKEDLARRNMHRFSIRALMVLIVVLTFDAFERIGHAIFALLLGLLGGTVAVWFYARRERATAAGGGSPV